MATFEGYLIVDANNPDEPEGAIWWDGEHTRASSDAILRQLKKMMIPFGTDHKQGTSVTIASGKEFFDQLPLAFKSGYSYLKKSKINEKGEPV